MDRPHGVQRTATTSPITTSGATIKVSTSDGVIRTVPTVNDRSKGTGTGL